MHPKKSLNISIFIFLCLLTSHCAQLCNTNADCNDYNLCTTDTCIMVGGLGTICQFKNKTAGTLCADSNFCNGVETCNGNGVCISGTPPCPSSSNLTTVCFSTCNAVNQSCNAPIGTPCSDSLWCTLNDTCSGQGSCVGGSQSPCSSQQTCNNTCNESARTCSTPANTTCDDGLYCNGQDWCDGNGTCIYEGTNPCASQNGDCKTTNCTEQYRCYQPSGTMCSNEMGDPYNCTTDSCNSEGICMHSPQSGCDDSEPCTTLDMCVQESGGYTCIGTYICACQNDSNCNDGNPCTVDVCSTGNCTYTPLHGTNCTDLNWCNGEDTCINGVCTPSGISPCNMSDPCNNFCNGTSCWSLPGTPCEDGLWCTILDTCSEGICVSGLPHRCQGNGPCNSTCNEGDQNCYAPNTVYCNNTYFCDGYEMCNGQGLCVSSGNPCNTNAECQKGCDEQNDMCTSNINGVLCSGNRCDGDHFCLNGICTSTLISPCNTTSCCDPDPSAPICFRNSTCPIDTNSTTTDEPDNQSSSSSNDLLLESFYMYAIVGGGLVLCGTVAITSILVLARRKSERRLAKRESHQAFFNPISLDTDRELAMGTIGNFSGSYRDSYKNKSQIFVSECRVNGITVQNLLGSGNFGEVFKGSWVHSGRTLQVALKKLKDPEHFEEFISEAVILKEFSHENVVKFYGIFVDNGTNFIVTEFMNRGSLVDYLKSANPSLQDLKEMALGAARGMEYLSSKAVIHRDLACRNLLVSYETGHYIVKVSDFGMSRAVEQYYYSASNKIPIRWSAPEVLRYKKFTPQSDVWSFGVCLWEMYSGGAEPYPSMSNAETIESVISGYRMPVPPNCPKSIYDVMNMCWEDDFHLRPSFSQIVEILTSTLDNFVEQEDLDELPSYNAQWNVLQIGIK